MIEIMGMEKIEMKIAGYYALIFIIGGLSFYLIDSTFVYFFANVFSDKAVVFNISTFLGYCFSLIPTMFFLGRSQFLQELSRKRASILGVASLLVMAILCGLGLWGALFLSGVLYFGYSQKVTKNHGARE